MASGLVFENRQQERGKRSRHPQPPDLQLSISASEPPPSLLLLFEKIAPCDMRPPAVPLQTVSRAVRCLPSMCANCARSRCTRSTVSVRSRICFSADLSSRANAAAHATTHHTINRDKQPPRNVYRQC